MEPAKLDFKSRGCELAITTLLIVFFAVPCAAFLKNLFIGGDWVSLNGDFAQIVLNSVVFTAVEAALSALFACAAGLALGALLSGKWYEMPSGLRGLLEGLGLFYFVLPGVVTASWVIELLKFLGLAEQGYIAVVVANASMNILFIATVIAERTALFQKSDAARQLDAAAMLGASRVFRARIFFENVWREQLKFFAPLVFLWSASSFATVIMLGGSPSRSTPEVILFYTLQHDASLVRVFVLFLVQLVLGLGLYRLSLSRLTSAPALGVEPAPAKSKWSWPALAVTLIFVGPLLHVLAHLSTPSMPLDLWTALAASVGAAVSAALFVFGLWWFLAQVGSQQRRLVMMGCGLSTTMLATLWSQLHFDRWLEGRPVLQIILLGLACAVAFAPLLALWLELRIGTLPTAQVDTALLLGCKPTEVPRRLYLPQTKDIAAKAAAFVTLATLGELSFAGIFVFDAPLLSTLSKSMALRYDFSGNQIVLGLIGLLTMAMVAVSARPSSRKIRTQ